MFGTDLRPCRILWCDFFRDSSMDFPGFWNSYSTGGQLKRSFWYSRGSFVIKRSIYSIYLIYKNWYLSQIILFHTAGVCSCKRRCSTSNTSLCQNHTPPLLPQGNLASSHSEMSTKSSRCFQTGNPDFLAKEPSSTLFHGLKKLTWTWNTEVSQWIPRVNCQLSLPVNQNEMNQILNTLRTLGSFKPNSSIGKYFCNLYKICQKIVTLVYHLANYYFK